mmetsp:Transcript_26930/g.78507  ORF Transcript_26930/g.78507 Transcript_26930/m.78507 type:complete len:255 (+) Transcript_26930:6430-7194(+)
MEHARPRVTDTSAAPSGMAGAKRARATGSDTSCDRLRRRKEPRRPTRPEERFAGTSTGRAYGSSPAPSPACESGCDTPSPPAQRRMRASAEEPGELGGIRTSADAGAPAPEARPKADLSHSAVELRRAVPEGVREWPRADPEEVVRRCASSRPKSDKRRAGRSGEPVGGACSPSADPSRGPASSASAAESVAAAPPPSPCLAPSRSPLPPPSSPPRPAAACWAQLSPPSASVGGAADCSSGQVPSAPRLIPRTV